MRVAVIGAGIVGVTTAYELAADGHAVTVLERRASVAEETSFANAGLVAPAYVTPWASPGMPAKVLGQLFKRHSAISLARPWADGQLAWMLRWWRACSAPVWQANRASMYALANYSQQRLAALSRDLNLSYEQGKGYLVLLREAQELSLARPGLAMMADMGAKFQLLNAEQARAVEPGLNPDTPLHAAVHLPTAVLGNCRQFAQLMRTEGQRLGVVYRFHREVLRIVDGTQPAVHHRTAELGASQDTTVQQDQFDAVVVCAAVGSRQLLANLGLRLPLLPVHGYSISAPLRLVEGHPELGPQGAVMDERYKVAISRLGSRIRVAGSAEVGGRLSQLRESAVDTLYKILNDWYPGAAQLAHVQAWKGARPMLPDGPPVLGGSGRSGVWLNLGHGSSGWALACGSARVLADQLAQRAPAINVAGLDVSRLRR